MENSIERAERLRFIAARALRKDGYEVYTLPLTSVKHIPHLIACKGNVFYHVYLFESHSEKVALLKGSTKKKIFRYAEAMSSKVLTAVIHVVPSGEGLTLLLTAPE